MNSTIRIDASRADALETLAQLTTQLSREGAKFTAARVGAFWIITFEE